MPDDEAPPAIVTKPDPDAQSEIRRLAGLSPVAYDQQRETVAKALGIRTSTLDEQVRDQKKDAVGAGNDMEELEPWPDPVDGAELAEAIRGVIRLHVVLDHGADVALTLWAMGSYCYDCFRIYPKLLVTAATKRAGKTTLIEVMEAICRNAILASGMSAAVLYRALDKWHPTLLLDEIDAWLRDNEEARGIVNAGHTRRTSFVYRCVGDDHTPTKFSVWGPMALAGIGKPADTITDRSIEIVLKRKMRDEKCQRIPVDLFERCTDLRRKSERWHIDNAATLAAADPDVPAVGNDRAEDNWRPMLAIADLIGMGDEARSVFLGLHADDGEDDDGIITMLLGDIRSVFVRDRMGSADLVQALNGLEDRPWPTWHRGRPLTQNSLAKLLKDLKITPRQIRVLDKTLKGYMLEWFKDTFNRLLAPDPVPTETAKQTSVYAASSPTDNRNTSEPVSVADPLKPKQDAACFGVSVETPQQAGKKPTVRI